MKNDCQKEIGCDMHKSYSVFVQHKQKSGKFIPIRVHHNEEDLRGYLATLPSGCEIALETVGNWYWMVDAIEEAGHTPLLTNARKAKMMMCKRNKTDRLDAAGLATLLHNGTLPVVWIPPKEVRDLRDICRWRMFYSRQRAGIKNRIHATLAKYNIKVSGVSDAFSKKGIAIIKGLIGKLPAETGRCVEEALSYLDVIEEKINFCEKRIDELVKVTEEIRLLMSLPGVGKILATTIWLETGSPDRFPRAQNYASYVGVVPTVNSSGGKTYHRGVSPECNHYLKWAFVEAANVIAMMAPKRKWDLHVTKLYLRLKRKKGSGKAKVAVARHLAEAAWCMLTRKQEYREPEDKYREASSTRG